MSQEKKSNLRIDEILLWDGLVTETQVREALQHQKLHGGKIGSHLMRQGHVNEAGLVQALSRQLGCEGVILTGREIPADVIALVPQQVAIARTVIPFNYDLNAKTVDIACENPSDQDLLNELSFILKDRTIRLFIAAEIALKSAIARYYLAMPGREADQTGDMVKGIFASDPTYPQVSVGTRREPVYRGTILMVTDDQLADFRLREAMEMEHYRVVTTESADDAIDIISGQQFDTVFIRDSVQGDYIDLIDRLRKISPRTRVRYYDAATSLLTDSEGSTTIVDLQVRNLDLFTSLLSSREKLASNHSGTVGQYVDKLCRHIGIPDKDRLVITTAAYLHDLGRFYYGDATQLSDSRSQINLTIKLLDSLNYSPLVIGILRSMYINLREKYTKRLPIETLGGNILTVIDIFCEHIPVGQKMSLDRFEVVQRKFHDLKGKLFLSEVVDAFLNMIQKDILLPQPNEKFNQVMVYCDDEEIIAPVENRLRSEGFRTIKQSKLEAFIDLYKRSKPDILVLIEHGGPSKVVNLIDATISGGIDLKQVPTFLLTDVWVASQLTSIFDKGIEDLIPIDNNLNLLIVKMKKVRSRIEAASNIPMAPKDIPDGTGAMGNLVDMNLIDLLQALGPSRRTVRLTVSSNANELIMYLDRGDIVYAKLNEQQGAEAVYEGLNWKSGFWTVQPVTREQLPQPNNEFSNESILMEGCRLIDEKQKTS